MKYYKIEMTDNQKVIGHYPQAKYEEGYNPRKEGIFSIKQNRFPDFTPRLDLRLHQESIITDYLDSSLVPFGMIVSEKMKFILEKTKLPKHKFYPINVFQEDLSFTYYWFHFIIDDFWDCIDKDKSYGKVLRIDDNFSLKRTIPAISIEENRKEMLTREAKTIKKIGIIVMNDKFPKYDIYKTAFIEHKDLISESFKKLIKENSITGMEIKPFEKFIISY